VQKNKFPHGSTVTSIPIQLFDYKRSKHFNETLSQLKRYRPNQLPQRHPLIVTTSCVTRLVVNYEPGSNVNKNIEQLYVERTTERAEEGKWKSNPPVVEHRRFGEVKILDSTSSRMAMRLSSSARGALAPLKASLLNTSVVIKAISAILIFVYLLSFIPGVFEGMALIPEKFWPPNFYVWTAVTHSFIEVHVWLVLIDLIVIILAGKLLEPLWGAVEMIAFFFAVNTGVAIFCAFFYYFLYMMTQNTDYLFEVHINGERVLSFTSSRHVNVHLSRHVWVPSGNNGGSETGHA
jgi:membrane associated rhomboid family serine protease